MEGSEDFVVLWIILEWFFCDVVVVFMNDLDYVLYLIVRINGLKSFYYLIDGKDDLV